MHCCWIYIALMFTFILHCCLNVYKYALLFGYALLIELIYFDVLKLHTLKFVFHLMCQL